MPSPSRNKPGPTGTRRPVLFLDRDGVINIDSADYIKHRREFHFIDGSLSALVRLSKAGYRLIVATNQSGVARGYTSLDELLAIHRQLREAVADTGGCIEDIFFCPHLPDDGCECRKPKPGLLHAARERHGLDLSQSTMVGDSAKDILCARNAGCATAVLVLTGNGPRALSELQSQNAAPDHVADNLLDAALWLLAGG